MDNNTRETKKYKKLRFKNNFHGTFLLQIGFFKVIFKAYNFECLLDKTPFEIFFYVNEVIVQGEAIYKCRLLQSKSIISAT